MRFEQVRQRIRSIVGTNAGEQKIQVVEKGFDVQTCPAQLMLFSAAYRIGRSHCLSWVFCCGVHFILIIDRGEARRNQTGRN